MVDLIGSRLNIESGNTGYNLNLLENIISFSTYPLSELSEKDFAPPTDLREKLIEKYEGDLKYSILSKKPTIVYAIKYKLLRSNFIDEFKETNEIKKFFEQFGWSFEGPSITNALMRMPKIIEIKRHESKGSTNLYRKINQSTH
jgi:hypothetical protein